jgi:hypothetical protein
LAIVQALALSATYTLTLLPSHITIASARLGNATARVAAATIVTITIITATTMATNTKAPHSNGHSP